VDIRSAALSLAAVLAVIYGVKQLAQTGPSRLAAAAIVTGLLVGVLFVRRQGKLAHPLLDLALFRVPAFSAALTTYGLGIFVVFGLDIFVAQYLQLVLGLSPMRAGLWSVPAALGFIVGSMLAPLLVRRVRPVLAIVAGLLVAAAGLGLLTEVGGSTALAVLVTGSVVLSIGLAPVFTLATDLIVGTAPPERAGAASAISETAAELGGALGIAILGVVGTAVYRGQVTVAISSGVPSGEATATRDTLGGAVAAAGRLPDDLGAALLAAARDAFGHGLHVVAAISAGVAIGSAVLAAVMLRDSPSSDTEQDAVAEPAAALT
jgi:DHA2 family multidrug resistance protein-like MFS transporter